MGILAKVGRAWELVKAEPLPYLLVAAVGVVLGYVPFNRIPLPGSGYVPRLGTIVMGLFLAVSQGWIAWMLARQAAGTKPDIVAAARETVPGLGWLSLLGVIYAATDMALSRYVVPTYGAFGRELLVGSYLLAAYLMLLVRLSSCPVALEKAPLADAVRAGIEAIMAAPWQLFFVWFVLGLFGTGLAKGIFAIAQAAEGGYTVAELAIRCLTGLLGVFFGCIVALYARPAAKGTGGA